MNLAGAVTLNADAGALPAKYERIAEIIRDYDPDLELAWIPPSARLREDKEPFAIFHNNPRYLVGTFSEDKMDHRILAHLFMINNQNGSVLERLEAEDRARKLLEYKNQMEEMEIAHDFAKTVIKSKKHRFKHNGRVYE